MSEYFTHPELETLDIAALHRKNSHGLIADLRELFKTKKLNEHSYGRISATGELGLCDYNAGFVSVQARVYWNWANSKDGAPLYSVGVNVTTLDDGGWYGHGKMYDTLPEAIEALVKVVPLLDDLEVLPTSEALNELLRPHGIYGSFE